EHVVDRDERHARVVGDGREAPEPSRVVAAIQYAGGEPDVARRGGGEEGEDSPPARRAMRHHNEIEPRDVLDQIVEKQNALGLLSPAFADGEQTRQAAPRIAVLRI